MTPHRTAKLLALVLCSPALLLAQTWTVGMSEKLAPIAAYNVPAQIADAPDVLVIGGLSGEQASANEVREAYEGYANTSDNFLDVTFIPSANPDAAALTFPPPEPAYQGNWTAWSLWHWIATHAPDTVIIVGEGPHALGDALASNLMDMGVIQVTTMESANEILDAVSGRKTIAMSPPHAALIERDARSVESIATGLSGVYGQQLGALTYIPGMALIGRLRLGQLETVEQIVAPTLAANAALEINNSLQIAGHLLYAELAERTGKAEYLALAKRAADLAFDENGQMKEAMPFHGDYSDAFFMATPLLAKVGKLTGDTRYFDMALQHVEFMHALLIRPDGLYNHWPRAEAAWGRGNAFVALGLALALSDFPESHAGHARLQTLFREHIKALVTHLDADGMWHNVIDIKGSWAEFSATAMIATAIERGVNKHWLDETYRGLVDSNWAALRSRVDADYGFIDVCESTPGQESLTVYLNRRALTGRDDRTGGMLLMLTTELLERPTSAE